MRPEIAITALFAGAAVYDGLLGLLFLVVPGWIFEQFGVPPPNHFGYVQFSAALLLVFAWMFVDIARRPVEYRGLIVYGVGMHLAYSGLVFWYWSTSGLPALWKPFAFVDLALAVFFFVAYRAIGEAKLALRAAA
jgi:hypothetical protein